MSFRDTIKQYFRTGLYPTQAQFWEWMDKIFFKDDNFNSNRIEATGQGQIDIPGNTWIDKIAFIGDQVLTVDVGTLPASDNVISQEPVNNTGSFDRDVWFSDAGTLYFTGIVPTTKIIIFIR